MQIPILFENDDIVVVNKPVGLAVHPGSGTSMSETLAGDLLKLYPDLPISNGEDRPGIVHRLDKDTSGVMLVAKTEEALAFYIEQWKKHKVEKIYLALVAGILSPETGTIEAPVSRDMKNRQRMSAIQAGSKMAITHYEVVKYFPQLDNATTLVRVRIETGKTHQIRVHFAAIGFPVVGDEVYGSRHYNKAFREIYGLKRQFLHAHELEFPLMGIKVSAKKKRERVICELPADLQDTLKRVTDQEAGELVG